MTLPNYAPPRDYVYRDRDNAGRFRDVVNSAHLQLSIEELMAVRWVSMSLDTCWSPGDIYETVDKAIDLWPLSDPNKVIYFQIPLEMLPLQVCDTLLNYYRGVYLAGFRPATSHRGSVLMLPHNAERYAG